MKVVGLDLSLTGTGVAVLRDGDAPRLAVIASKPSGPSIVERWRRLDKHASNVFDRIDEGWMEDGHPILYPDDHVVVEQPSYASQNGNQHERAGYWWMVVGAFTEQCHVSEVPPTTLKKFATGRGNASKAEMMAATAQHFPGVVFKDDNDSDALWLAVMGRAHVDPDLAGVPMTAYRTASLKAVAWA